MIPKQRILKSITERKDNKHDNPVFDNILFAHSLNFVKKDRK